MCADITWQIYVKIYISVFLFLNINNFWQINKQFLKICFKKIFTKNKFTDNSCGIYIYIHVCMYICVVQQEVDILLIMWIILSSRITPGPMLKASLICHVGDKGIVNIPIVKGVHLTLLYTIQEHMVNTSSSTCTSG